MKRRGILYFVLRVLLATLPLAVLPVWYTVMDPFRVLRSYPDGVGERGDSVRLAYNAGWVAISNYERYSPKHHFDSFIFGSSMSQNFKASWWQQYLSAGSEVYHMDQAMETLAGIADKLEYLLARGDTVANALIIIEEEMLHRDPQDEVFLFTRPPQTLRSPLATLHFHNVAFATFKDSEFLSWLVLDGGAPRTARATRFVSTDLQDRIPEINESYYARFDSLIAVSPNEYFTPERLHRIEWTPEPTAHRPGLTGERRDVLERVRRALIAHGSACHMILVPRYNRPAVSPADLDLLQSLPATVYDATGDTTLTRDPRRYYDHAGHPTAATCYQLLDASYHPTSQRP